MNLTQNMIKLQIKKKKKEILTLLTESLGLILQFCFQCSQAAILPKLTRPK